MTLPFVVVLGKRSLIDIVGTFSLQNNLSIFELLVKDLPKDKTLLQSMPFASMTQTKVGIRLLSWGGC